jgi:hypothetical protein
VSLLWSSLERSAIACSYRRWKTASLRHMARRNEVKGAGCCKRAQGKSVCRVHSSANRLVHCRVCWQLCNREAVQVGCAGVGTVNPHTLIHSCLFRRRQMTQHDCSVAGCCCQLLCGTHSSSEHWPPPILLRACCKQAAYNAEDTLSGACVERNACELQP